MWEECNYVEFSHLCEQDPVFYQTCGHVTCKHSLVAMDPPFVCGSFSCTQRKQHWERETGENKWRPNQWYEAKIGGIENNFKRCNDKEDCLNTKLDEKDCPKTTKACRLFGESIDINHFCDGKCDCYLCEDESQCNRPNHTSYGRHLGPNHTSYGRHGGSNHGYGINCANNMLQRLNWSPRHYWPDYVPPAVICDGIEDCKNGADEANCTQITSHTCLNSQILRRVYTFEPQVEPVRIRNFTMAKVTLTKQNTCSVPNRLYLVCTNYRDQLNCSHLLESPLICKIDGFETHVSKYALCKVTHLCDDGLDGICSTPRGGCLIHKHRLCDNHNDCIPPDSEHAVGPDERVPGCNVMTNSTCHRRFQRNGQNQSLPIPLAWVMDGVSDCADDYDEDPSIWKTCGGSWTRRYIEKHSNCEDVFLCSNVSKEYSNISALCDGRSSACVMEADICQMSRKAPTTSDTMVRMRGGKYVLGMFLPGLEDLARLFGDSTTALIYTVDRPFGVSPFEVILPEKVKVDCRFVYGEMYVFLSCNGGCINSSCILVRPVKHDSCPNIAEQDRVLTLALDNNLTIARRKKGNYLSDLYPCKNGYCVSFDKVCNLVDDCGDGSDEVDCTNHFRCRSGEYVPLSSVRDGSLHCNDFSDECSEESNILSKPIAVVAWFLGALAVFLNAVVLISSIYKHFTAVQTSRVKSINTAFIVLISIGDLLMGSYLLTIASVNHQMNGTYCEKQLTWMVSGSCAAIGAFNTFGSQLSLFSMTCLSLYRLKCTSTSPTDQTSAVKCGLLLSVLITGIVFAAAFIALVPLSPSLEDFFVNGMYYEGVPLFIGAHSKKEYKEMLERYYSKIGDGSLTWKKIRPLVKEMFSTEYGGIKEQKLHFYGNDGVCLFKYFVDQADPQRHFVGLLHLINLSCLVIITINYITINIRVSRSSAKAVTKKDTKLLALQRKVAAIIATDFACWIPLIVCCFLHYLEVLDATESYGIFSIIVLPMNSAINPLLYDTTGVMECKRVIIRKVSGWITGTISRFGPSSTGMTAITDPPIQISENKL